MLNDDAKEAIKIIRQKAEAAGVMSLTDVLTQTPSPTSQFGDVIIDGMIWWIGYGIEQQVFGDCRHLSISHPTKLLVPDPEIIEEIAKEFGFEWQDVHLGTMHYPNRGLTVHAMERLEPVP